MPYTFGMWSPYQIGVSPKMRSLNTVEGLGDRLRLVAFAERQAYHAFREAILRFQDAPPGLRDAWNQVAEDEARHESWLVRRLQELNQDLASVPVGLNLYQSLKSCQSAKEFSLYVADAETRGKVGAEKFAEVLAKRDPETSRIFAQIAFEEQGHIALVDQYFRRTSSTFRS